MSYTLIQKSVRDSLLLNDTVARLAKVQGLLNQNRETVTSDLLSIIAQQDKDLSKRVCSVLPLIELSDEVIAIFAYHLTHNMLSNVRLACAVMLMSVQTSQV